MDPNIVIFTVIILAFRLHTAKLLHPYILTDDNLKRMQIVICYHLSCFLFPFFPFAIVQTENQAGTIFSPKALNSERSKSILPHPWPSLFGEKYSPRFWRPGRFYEERPCLPRLSRAFRSTEPSFSRVIAWHGSLARHSHEPTLGGEDRCQTTGFYT